MTTRHTTTAAALLRFRITIEADNGNEPETYVVDAVDEWKARTAAIARYQGALRGAGVDYIVDLLNVPHQHRTDGSNDLDTIKAMAQAAQCISHPFGLGDWFARAGVPMIEIREVGARKISGYACSTACREQAAKTAQTWGGVLR